MSEDSPVVVGKGRCVRETEQAILVEIDGRKDAFGYTSHREHWIPKSVVHDDSEVFAKGGEGKIVVQAWWVESEMDA